MTELITGALGTRVRDTLTERIKATLEEKKRAILIVPEQATLAFERDMSRALPSSAPLYFDVTNFTRFANTVERALGGLSAQPSDRARRALVMWDTVAELAPALTVLAPKAGISASLVNRAISAVNEMDSLGIDAGALADAEAKARKTNARLADKLSDLSLIIPLYRSLLLERYGDTGDELYKLRALLDSHPEYELPQNVFIYGFTSFTEAQYGIISCLMKRCSLTVALDIPRADADAFEYTEPRAAKARLISLANRMEEQISHIRLSEGERANPLLGELISYLWHPNCKIDNDCLQYKDTVRIFEAKDPYEECDHLAADIKRRISLGARYSDIAIVARNTDTYIGILDNALIKCGIPHFISKPKDIASFDAVKLIYSALETVAHGFERESLITYMKCGLLGLDRGACDDFELYCETWQIDRHRFTNGAFTMCPDGYTTRPDKDAQKRLKAINETKDTLIAPLLLLKEELDGAKTVKDHAIALVKFITGLRIEEKIEKKTLTLSALSEKEAAEEEGEILKLIYSSLDILVSSAADSSADIESFKSRLELVLSEAALGRIPSYLDEVLIGDANMLRSDSRRHVYLIGCNQGEFPGIPSDASYFTDRDRTALSGIGIETEKSSEYEYARELFYFTRALSGATESATLFYTLESFSFSEARRSEPIERIIALTDKAISPIKISSLPLKDRIYSPDTALELCKETGSEKLLSALLELGYADELARCGESITNEALALDAATPEAVYPSDIYLSQTRIDKFIDCPLSYFLSYTLKLSEWEPASFDARHIGSFIHSIFEAYFKEKHELEKAGGDTKEIDKEKIVRRAAEEYTSSLGTNASGGARLESIIDRLTKSALLVLDTLIEELAEAKYKPRFFELPIKDNKEGYPSASEFRTKDGRCVKLTGAIDRVDIYEREDGIYVRVVDYKTGTKEFSPKDLDKGRNLQMFLYLKAIVESRDEKFLELLGARDTKPLIPAGVIYVKTDFSDLKVSHQNFDGWFQAFAEAQKREGMLLDDKDSIAAMGSYAPVKFTKAGTPTKYTEDKLYTMSGWDELMKKVTDAVTRVATDMTHGIIEAKPMVTKNASPCEYCKFKPICRNAAVK